MSASAQAEADVFMKNRDKKVLDEAKQLSLPFLLCLE